jgi:CrcB protein
MLSVGLGSALGALLRYVISTWWKQHGMNWPLATLLINLTGAFALGLLIAHIPVKSQEMLFWGVGMLGGYTTFSTFNTEMIAMIDERKWTKFITYFVLTYAGGLFAAWLGMKL